MNHKYAIMSMDVVRDGEKTSENKIQDMRTGQTVAIVWGFHRANAVRDAIEKDEGVQQ